MKHLLIAWALTVAAIAAGGAYLWYAEIPEASAAASDATAGDEAAAAGTVLSTGPIEIVIPADDEDCYGTC